MAVWFFQMITDGLLFSLYFNTFYIIVLWLAPCPELIQNLQGIISHIKTQTASKRQLFRHIAFPVVLTYLWFLIGLLVDTYIAAPVGFLVLFAHLFVVHIIFIVITHIIRCWMRFHMAEPKFRVPANTKKQGFLCTVFPLGRLLKTILFSAADSALIAGICYLILSKLVWFSFC